MAQYEQPHSWSLPVASSLASSGFNVTVALRLHAHLDTRPTLWLSRCDPADVIRAAWNHEQTHGGIAEAFTWSDGVAIRAVQPPKLPFHSDDSAQAFAETSPGTGLFLPVGRSLRPSIRAATWQGLRMAKAIHLFGGTRWLVLPTHGFKTVDELVVVVSTSVQSAGISWSKASEPVQELAPEESTTVKITARPVHSSVGKVQSSLTQQLRQLFIPKKKAERTRTKSGLYNPVLPSKSSAKLIRNDLVQLLLKRECLSAAKEIEVWNTLAIAYDDVDEQQASLARSHAAWLHQTPTTDTRGYGVRAAWLAALQKFHQRDNDSLYLATVYDQLLHQIDAGLHRINDLPSFLWPKSDDSTSNLLALRDLFVEHGPREGIAAAFAGILFAAVALNCHEPTLAASWIAESSEMLQELRLCDTTQSLLALCDAVASDLHVRTILDTDRALTLHCPQTAMLTRRCQLLKNHLPRLSQNNVETSLLPGHIQSASAQQVLRVAEQDRTAAVLPRLIILLGVQRKCRTRDDVARWVALVPDAIELQAEFWRAHWPGETQFFDVQVRWCERLLTWAFEDLRWHQLDASNFLRRILTQAQERDTPLRTALMQSEWHVARCLKGSDHHHLQKNWLALGLLSSPSSLMLNGNMREATKTLDELTHRLSESPLESSITMRAASSFFSACFFMSGSQAMERGCSFLQILAARLSLQGDDDFIAWKNLITLDLLLSTLFSTPTARRQELLDWIADDEQRLRKRMALDISKVLADIN